MTNDKGAEHEKRSDGWRTATYKIWSAMKYRCLNPNARSYKLYGARGISVCERWHKFANFLGDMGECPKGLTLDRINPLGNYEPSNCRWATKTEQAHNVFRGKFLGCSSKYKGVWLVPSGDKYQTKIRQEHKTIGLGVYKNEVHAAFAYIIACKVLYGESIHKTGILEVMNDIESKAFEAGYKKAIAEVVPVLEDLMQTATWFFEGPYGASPPEDTLPRARALLEKIK